MIRVFGGFDAISVLPEPFGQRIANDKFVVDDKNALLRVLCGHDCLSFR
jgi:hypothetical protein